jgi:hypothetical protein
MATYALQKAVVLVKALAIPLRNATGRAMLQVESSHELSETIWI